MEELSIRPVWSIQALNAHAARHTALSANTILELPEERPKARKVHCLPASDRLRSIGQVRDAISTDPVLTMERVTIRVTVAIAQGVIHATAGTWQLGVGVPPSTLCAICARAVHPADSSVSPSPSLP